MFWLFVYLFLILFPFVFAFCINCLLTLASCLYIITEGLPSTKLHTLLLDHHNVKLTWYIDWPKKEVLFNVDDAFTDDTDWFSFGFSKRGQIEGSDICFFVRNIYDESYNEAIVSNKSMMTVVNRNIEKERLLLVFIFLRSVCDFYMYLCIIANLGHVRWN